MNEEPQELQDLYEDLILQLVRTARLIEYSRVQFARLPATLNLMRVAQEIAERKNLPHIPGQIAALEELLPELEAEKRNDFTFFHGLATIAVWSKLEAFIEEIALWWLTNHPRPLTSDALQKIKVPLVEYQAMTPDDRSAYIFAALENNTSASLKPGVGRFESVLDQLGLGGSVADLLRRILLELSEVRNALVHRRGKADRRLVTMCPWLGLSAGEEIRLSRATLTQYTTAVGVYAGDVYRRVLVAIEAPTEWIDGRQLVLSSAVSEENGSTPEDKQT